MLNIVSNIVIILPGIPAVSLQGIMYTAVLFAITREAIRSGKWKKINSVAKGKVTRNNELRHVHPRTYTAGSANTRSLSKLSVEGFAWILVGVGEFLARA